MALSSFNRTKLMLERELLNVELSLNESRKPIFLPSDVVSVGENYI